MPRIKDLSGTGEVAEAAFCSMDKDHQDRMARVQYPASAGKDMELVAAQAATAQKNVAKTEVVEQLDLYMLNGIELLTRQKFGSLR